MIWRSRLWTMYSTTAFLHGNEQSKMELEVTILNVNYGHNKELMEQCRTLKEYAIFVAKIKKYKKEMELTDAITKAIDECVEEDVLREFLLRRKKEVMNSILTQYDEEKVMQMISEESYEDGLRDGEERGMKIGEERGMKIGEERGMKIGEERGMKLGEARVKALTQKLTEANRFDDLKRIFSDEEYCAKLYKEFGIE